MMSSSSSPPLLPRISLLIVTFIILAVGVLQLHSRKVGYYAETTTFSVDGAVGPRDDADGVMMVVHNTAKVDTRRRPSDDIRKNTNALSTTARSGSSSSRPFIETWKADIQIGGSAKSILTASLRRPEPRYPEVMESSTTDAARSLQSSSSSCAVADNCRGFLGMAGARVHQDRPFGICVEGCVVLPLGWYLGLQWKCGDCPQS